VTPLSLAQRELDRQSRVGWAQLVAAAENDFEEPVFAAHGALRQIKLSLKASGAELAMLSGSGATVFGIFADETRARLAQARFVRENSMKVFVVPTCSSPLAWRYD
jgi:4-diphosphocytidyl-2-C-methyl-D-erythritol kinase